MAGQNMIGKLNNDNQLVKTNLREVYEELLTLVFPDQNDSERTFEEIMDQLAESLDHYRRLHEENPHIAKEVTLLRQENQGFKS